MKRLFLALALLLPLAVGAVVYVTSDPEPEDATEVVERRADDSVDRSAVEAPEPATLRGRAEPASPETNEGEPAPPGQETAPDGESPRRLTGRVTDERDVPVAGVVLEVDPSPWMDSGPPAVSEHDGTFVLHMFSPGAANLRVRPGEGWSPLLPVHVRADQDHVHVRLQRSTSMRIRVLDATGAPAAGVPFHVADVKLGADATHSVGGRAAGHADAGGVYVVRGLPPEGRLEVCVGGDAWPDVRWRDVAIDADGLLLRLPPPAVLEGVLQDEDGTPLGGVGMAAKGCDPSTWHMSRGTESDVATGRFRFDVLAPGRYRLDVKTPKGFSEEHELRFVHAPRTGLRVRLPRLVMLTGTVQGDDPTRVTVTWCMTGQRADRTPSTDGTFVFESVPNLKGSLYAHDESSGDAFLLEAVRPGEGPFTVHVQPARTIEGRVPGFSTSRRDAVLIGARRGLLLIEGKVHADDTFTLRGVPPGVWAVELWDDGACIRVDEVDAGTQDVVVPLD